mmetsp:Transcript_5959/g.15268  ORF Transcript_5959/g.15268 Transcript_5959/m.15268 type:complete len:225 (+) Transcript_5959:161-835(+)
MRPPGHQRPAMSACGNGADCPTPPGPELRRLSTSVCETTPMRISIALASCLSLVRADLILTIGEVSIIAEPRSSIRPLIVCSSSVTAASSVCSRLMSSDDLLYSSCLAAKSACLAAYSWMSDSHCMLSFCSILPTMSSVSVSSLRIFSSAPVDAGIRSATASWWAFACAMCVRHSLPSETTVTLSCGSTRSSSSLHSSGSMLGSIVVGACVLPPPSATWIPAAP